MAKFDPVGSCYTNGFSTAELSETSENEERDLLTGTILSAAIEVHRALGPGLLESAYVNCLLLNLNVLMLKDGGIRRMIVR